MLPTAPTSPLVDLRYTASAPLVGECQVTRDGSRWVLRPHAPHVEGQCSCCAEITLVMDVDVALSVVSAGRWLVTRNDGADLGHLTDVPEPAPWLPVIDVLDAVITALAPTLGAPSHDCRTHGPSAHVTWIRGVAEVMAWCGMDRVARVAVYANGVACWGPFCVGGEDEGVAVTLEALPTSVRDTLTRFGISLIPTAP